MPGTETETEQGVDRTWTVRPVTTDDAEAVVALMAAAEAADRTEEHYDLGDVEEELANPDVDLGRDWLVAEEDGVLLAQQHLVPRAPVDGVQKIYLQGTVRPGHRGRGIGTDLVGRLAERAREHAAERGARVHLSATAPSDLADAEGLLVDHGLQPHRWTFVMEADLGDVATPPDLPEGFRLETWEGIDPTEVREVHNRAFVGHPGFTPWSASMWQQWVTGSRNDRPALSLALRGADGAVAAYVHTQVFDAVETATGRRETFVAKVGVVPEHRRRGLGRLVLQHAVWRHAREGYAATSLDVDYDNPTGANALYESVGFRVTRRWTNFERTDVERAD